MNAGTQASASAAQDRRVLVRYFASAAAAATAALYLLIGFGVLWVGEAAAGGTPDLLGFGLVTGGTFAAAAIALLVMHSRLVLLAVALLQVVAIVGYVAMSDLRTPPFEPWGLLVKACQVFVLVAVGYLFVRGPEHASVSAYSERHRV